MGKELCGAASATFCPLVPAVKPAPMAAPMATWHDWLNSRRESGVVILIPFPRCIAERSTQTDVRVFRSSIVPISGCVRHT